jgi:hypothetical protein
MSRRVNLAFRYAPCWSVRQTALLWVVPSNPHLRRRMHSTICLNSQCEAAVHDHFHKYLQMRKIGRYSRTFSFDIAKDDFGVPYRYPSTFLYFSSTCMGVLTLEREDYQKKQYRFLSAKSVDTSHNRIVTSGESSSSINPSDVKPTGSRSTDPEFTSYLTGEMKPPSILDELTKLSSGAVISQRRSSAAKRSRSFALDTNDKEVYRQIVDLQASQKEKSRQKTFVNVYRALMGNVIICTGTLLILVDYFSVW